MLIVQVEPPQNAQGGDYYYRTHAPGIAMAHQEGVYVINLTSQHRCAFDIMAEADVLILNDVCHPDLLPLIKRYPLSTENCSNVTNRRRKKVNGEYGLNEFTQL